LTCGLRPSPTLARPQRGQTTVTAGLDLRIATIPHTRTTPTGSHGREKANPSMCDLSEVGSILGARLTAGQDLRLCKCDLSEVSGKRNTARQRPSTRRCRLTRPCGRSFISRLQSFFVGFCSSVKDSLTKYYTSSITYSSNSERGMLASHESTSKYWQLVA